MHTTDISRDDRLNRARVAIADGVQLYDFLRAWNEHEPLSEMEQRCVEHAREHLVRDGEIEIDEPTICSIGVEENRIQRGTYVLAWLWVDNPDFKE